MFRELWDAFCEWASDALNWLRNFFSKVWDTIVSWWDALCDTINEWLESFNDEVVAINVDTEIGKRIYEMIKDAQPNVRSISKYHKTELLHFDKETGELKQVANFETDNIQNESDFEKDLRNSDGVLRLNK